MSKTENNYFSYTSCRLTAKVDTVNYYNCTLKIEFGPFCVGDKFSKISITTFNNKIELWVYDNKSKKICIWSEVIKNTPIGMEDYV